MAPISQRIALNCDTTSQVPLPQHDGYFGLGSHQCVISRLMQEPEIDPK